MGNFCYIYSMFRKACSFCAAIARDNGAGKAELSSFGEPIEMILPKFADENGDWLSSLEIAQSIWS